jgi:hypothetical protein
VPDGCVGIGVNTGSESVAGGVGTEAVPEDGGGFGGNKYAVGQASARDRLASH